MKRIPTIAVACLAFFPATALGSTVYVWGQPHSPTGQLGTLNASPTAVSGIPATVVQVATTNTDYYALTADGQVWAWGAARNGELGDGQPVTSEPQFTTTPTQVVFPTGTVIQSLFTDTAGQADGLALDTNGNLWGWGYNHADELCMKGTNVTTPVIVAANVTLFAGAADHTIYEQNGSAYGCGTNLADDLGDGSTRQHSGPKPVRVQMPVGETPAALNAGFHNSGALMTDGSVWMWGLGKGGQLGSGTSHDSDVPVQVPLQAPAIQLYVGGSLASNGQSIVVLTDGTDWSWGTGQYGQNGDGNTSDALTPVQVDGTFTTVASGGAAEYGLDASGTLWSWGENNSGQLGIGKADTKSHTRPIDTGVMLSQVASTAFDAIGLQP
jgi:alpha-tubulin suppressor-like RCC1 family protein